MMTNGLHIFGSCPILKNLFNYTVPNYTSSIVITSEFFLGLFIGE